MSQNFFWFSFFLGFTLLASLASCSITPPPQDDWWGSPVSERREWPERGDRGGRDGYREWRGTVWGASLSQTSALTLERATYDLTFSTPGGTPSAQIMVGLGTGGTITEVTGTITPADHEDESYFRRFLRGAQNEIIGKKMADLTGLRAVGGASLTTAAFLEKTR